LFKLIFTENTPSLSACDCNFPDEPMTVLTPIPVSLVNSSFKSSRVNYTFAAAATVISLGKAANGNANKNANTIKINFFIRIF
jgi:hypothetical protein